MDTREPAEHPTVGTTTTKNYPTQESDVTKMVTEAIPDFAPPHTEKQQLFINKTPTENTGMRLKSLHWRDQDRLY